MAQEVDLQKMRYDALLKITRTMGGAALSGAVPTPTLELAKQLGISIADAWMCFDIYKTYFEKDLTKQDLAGMLQTAGVVILGVASLAMWASGWRKRCSAKSWNRFPSPTRSSPASPSAARPSSSAWPGWRWWSGAFFCKRLMSLKPAAMRFVAATASESMRAAAAPARRHQR